MGKHLSYPYVIFCGPNRTTHECDPFITQEADSGPLPAPHVSPSSVLVELHDFIMPGVTEDLRMRFGATHHIKHIWEQPRSHLQFPWRTLGTALLPRSDLEWGVREWRPERMAWLWMEPLG